MSGERDVARAEDGCVVLLRSAPGGGLRSPKIRVSFAAISEFHVICTFSLSQTVKLVNNKLLLMHLMQLSLYLLPLRNARHQSMLLPPAKLVLPLPLRRPSSPFAELTMAGHGEAVTSAG